MLRIFLFCLVTIPSIACAEAPIDIGNRRELFVDEYLIESIDESLSLQVKRPDPQEVIFEADEPWEGNTSGYYSFFQDDDLYRMVYRGWQHDDKKKAAHKEITCYAESRDGIHWTKPKLGLLEWNGSKENNIVWLGPGTHNFTAFLDTNPAVAPDARYKAFGGGRGGLLPFASADCINWRLLQDKPIITHGAFDSQNLAFWDPDRNEYRAYWRYFGDGVRAIRTATSKDFLHWENEADLKYPEGTPNEHLYTNAIQKYYRAPHLFIGFPTRYDPKSQQVEPILMTSRDGVLFKRFNDPVIPRTAPKDRNHNRSNYMAWGMFPLPGKPNEISVYGTENYYESTPGRVRRFVYRVDGFAALHAGDQQGQVTTKPLKFAGKELHMNYVVQAGGMLQVEVLDDTDKVLAKESLTGDHIDETLSWKSTSNSGVVTLRFTMKNADVYSFKFQ